MSDDIVADLRIIWTSCSDRINRERASAADEIERLRAGGCARDQRTTQFCAEAVTLQREVEMLREMVAEMRERNNKLLHRLQEYEAREAE